MSNYLAIATVTATLQKILQDAIQEDLSDARVTTLRPDNLQTGGVATTGVNLFLYKVQASPAWRNADTPGRRPKGDLVKKSQVGLDLQYIISFYGKDEELETQRLVGSVVRTLQDRATLTPDVIRATITDSTFPFLADSDLADQVEPIRFTPLDLSTEELSQVWSGFFQTPYLFSLVYKGTVVFIEGEVSGERALPVSDRRTAVAPFQQISVDRAISAEGATRPILADSTVLVQGRALYHTEVRVRLGEVEVEPSESSNTQLQISLASVPVADLRAGAQSLQVIHPQASPRSDEPERQIESNATAFVLRPTVTEVAVENLRSRSGNRCHAEVTITCNVTIGSNQRAILILNDRASSDPGTYLFKANPRDRDSQTVQFSLQDVNPSEYLVRLQIDGAESLLTIETDPRSPRVNQYVGPLLSLEG